MKKKLIGALVGGLLIFIWQMFSHMVLNLHGDEEMYTAKQDSVLSALRSQITEEGQYFLPNLPPGSSMDEMKKLGENTMGKPWAMVSYHNSYDMNIGTAMVRTALVDIAMVLLLCWILFEFGTASFFTIFFSSVFTGLIVFLNAFYTNHIWFQTFGITANLVDLLVSWGICGIWLAWWLRKK